MLRKLFPCFVLLRLSPLFKLQELFAAAGLGMRSDEEEIKTHSHEQRVMPSN